jgi:NADH-quinone oxidoreductase subunit N
MTTDMIISIQAILPLVILVVWACVLLLLDLFFFKRRLEITALLAGIGLVVALVVELTRLSLTTPAFGGMLMIDGFSHFLNVLLLLSGLGGIALAYDYLSRTDLRHGEYYSLLLFAVCGMMLMGMSSDLIIVFLAIELLSFPLYVMAGIAVPRLSSEEASIKYFLLGAFASGFFVYGTALVYGATATTSIKGIASAVEAGASDLPLYLIGSALILIGLSFKVAIVPFHMWTPDVYTGAPTSVTAFMAIGAKVAGFAALLRVFILAFTTLSVNLTPVLWALAALTMILGNLVAISQSNIKRMLAYSSIAHAGYILMALVPYGQAALYQQTVASALFYLVAYAFTSFAAWAVVIALEQAGERGLEIRDYAGLGRKHPALAAVMAVAMLSFTGVPPTLGFFGKFYLFGNVIAGGFYGLALIGVVTSLVSAFYYLRVIVVMYMQDGEPVVRREPLLYLTAYLTAAGIVLLGIFASPLLNWASQAMMQLF